jgi:hypothetical protein
MRGLLQPSLTPSDMEVLIEAGSNQAHCNTAGVLDAVRRLVQGPTIKPTAVSSWSARFPALFSMDAARVDFANNNKALPSTLQNDAVFKPLVDKPTLRGRIQK